MNEGLKQIALMLQNPEMKRIVFELEEGNTLKLGFYRKDYQSIVNKITFEALQTSIIDYLSIILSNMLDIGQEEEIIEQKEENKEGNNEAT